MVEPRGEMDRELLPADKEEGRKGNSLEAGHCRGSSPVVSSSSGKQKEPLRVLNGEQKRCGKGVFGK